MAILVASSNVDFQSATSFYKSVGARSMSPQVENTVFEQLFLSLHHLSALEKMAKIDQPADVARISILAWYYGVTNAASAMIAAQNSSFQEDHNGTARMWDEVIASKGLALEPFCWRISSLVKSEITAEISALRGSLLPSNLTNRPTTTNEARSATLSYLSGSADWWAWAVSEQVKKSKEFRGLQALDFRKAAARELRDAKLRDRTVGFLHQAIRYRGKANYREALFLAHGKGTNAQLAGYVGDLALVLRAFVAMAGAFSSRKLGASMWTGFVTDVESHRAFSTSATGIWR